MQVDVADTQAIPWRQLLGWSWLWLARKERAYSDDKYFGWATTMADQHPDYFGQQRI